MRVGARVMHTVYHAMATVLGAIEGSYNQWKLGWDYPAGVSATQLIAGTGPNMSDLHPGYDWGASGVNLVCPFDHTDPFCDNCGLGKESK